MTEAALEAPCPKCEGRGWLVDTDGTIVSKGQPIFKISPDEIVVQESAEEIAARRLKITNEFLQLL